jgi:phytoene synthase
MNDAIVDHSHEMIRRGSKSFAAAAWLFDPETRVRAYMLYAWCRHCDDQIDGQSLGLAAGRLAPAERLARLEALRASTEEVFLGRAMRDPVFAAFQRVARDATIPQRYAMELLAGFEMDVTGARYRELPDTLLYCHRVAGVVGIMMAYVMGVRDEAVLARAADLGIAFQLTNIARDVLDDAANGRCYLPEAWLREAQVPAGRHADPACRPAVWRVVTRLLDEADRYYASAKHGLKALPLRSAWAVSAALGIYREIGSIVRARGTAAWDSRAVVSRPRKAWHGVMGFPRALRASTLDRWTAHGPREPTLWMVADLRAKD